MKAVVMEKNADHLIDIPQAREAARIRIVKPSCNAGVDERILDPDAMSILTVERQQVKAADVICNRTSRRRLQDYRSLIKRHEQSNMLSASAKKINAMTVQDGYIPHHLSHQEMTGKEVRRQAEYILRAPFMKAIASHPDYGDLPGFEVPKRVMKETMDILNLLRRVGNLFRKNKIQTMNGSPAEVNIADRCFGSLWPAGVNLYSVLRELYPAFHARIAGQVPVYVASVLDDLPGNPLDSRSVKGIGRFGLDRHGRFLGLYPVCEVPPEQVTSDSTFVSQDQLGRKAIVNRMLEDISSVVRKTEAPFVLVIDYAGGAGNMSELLLKKVYEMSDENLKKLLLSGIRVAVVDAAEDQLAAGRNRFQQIDKKTQYAGIQDQIIFLKGDVTRPLTALHLLAMKYKFGEDFCAAPLCLGMTSYTIGALGNITLEDGTTAPQAMADEMFKQCWKVYAVDFSSPMWRMAGFLKDTGQWGREYLRVVHGLADRDDEREPMHRLASLYLKLRFGKALASVADFVRFMSIGSALASHYTTVWPDSDGHNAGYCVQEDGSLKKPGILSFAERLQGKGANLYYKSRVWLFGTLDIGKADGGNRAWAFIPGWVADFVVAENQHHQPSQ